ncbi:MAG: hypothetical protein A3H79_01680 [Candidatus Levybacteria bacterium RIFCSPLOWO2_02_FULL_36_8b]|nr:MAG: hypothetical protein A3H79_01680 [Candidatus Levybacteria bacterium RIFCSPLOWO2_02_FULL_36_8b]
MPEEPQPKPDLTASLELQDRLQRINDRRTEDLVYVDEYDLREISSRAYQVGESDRAKVRPVLKKIMNVSVPWARGAKFIRETLYDLAYSPQEISVLSEEAQKAAQREQEISAEVSNGVSPWLARVHHNEHGIRNPYVVGFFQDETGQIKPVYGQRYFRSQRQIENTIFAGRTEVKEVNLLDTQFYPTPNAEILRGENWDLLPDDLRARFNKGELLVTGRDDTYRLNDSDVDALAKSDDPKAIVNHVESKTRQAAAGPKKYFLLYYSDYRSDETGRTGVVMIGENGGIKPLTVLVDDKQFVVEVKGCGMKSGGFGKMHFRTGRDIITGGAEKEQAENEFYRLQDDKRDDAPKAVGSILFSNNGYEQGYIIRLTPSTIRAAYSDNECYPQIESPDMVERILPMYSQLLVDHIYSSTPKVLDRSSHTENLLIWGNGEFSFTDFSDHVAFADKYFPHEENHGGYMTPKQMLKYYVEMVREVPGYVADRDRVSFYDTLNRAFQDKGVALGVEITDDPEQVIQKIWERAMAYQVFNARRQNGYVAEGILKEAQDLVIDSFAIKDISFDTPESFRERFNKGKTDIQTAIDLIKARSADDADKKVVDEWMGLLQEGNLYDALSRLNDVFNAYRNIKDLSEDEQSSIYKAISYFSSFDYALVNPYQKYFEHELDVIKSAQQNVPEQERASLQSAEQELNQRIQSFKVLINGDLGVVMNTLKDPQKTRELISFRFYGK